MTYAECQRETVPTLREGIRFHREMMKETADPLAKIPKGLSKMKSEDLQAEVQLTGLPEIPNASRAQLEIQIRDDVAARTILSTQAMSSEQPLDDDFEMVPERRAKAKAKSKA